MNREVRDEWVAALRSGDYKQGAGWLQPTKNTFCCLGVLCKVAEQHGIAVRHNVNGFVRADRGQQFGLLPSKVSEWADFGGRGVQENNVDEWLLAHANDASVPFSGIADIIEREF